MLKTSWPRGLFLGLLIVVLASCAGQPAAARRVTFMTFGDPAERDAYRALVDAFHAAQQEVRVDITHIPDPADYRTRLATEFAAGSPPDVMLMNYRRFAAFAAAGVLEPLGPYLARSDRIAADAFYSVTIDAFQWQGTLTCIPQNISSLVVYYNRTLFEAAGVPLPQAGWRWEEFLAAARALTRDTDGDGQVDQYGLGVEPSLFRLAPFVWQNGGRLVDSVAQPSRLVLTRPPDQEALAWFVALQTEHRVVPSRVEEAALDSESRFLSGRSAMYLNSRRGTPTYRTIQAFEWDIAPLPQGKEAAGVLHSDGYCMAATTADKEAAWRFIEFANGPEGQRIVAQSGRTVPSLRAVAESEAFLDPSQPPASSHVFLDTIPTLRLVPVMSTWEDVEKVASSEIERAFYGDISVAEAATLAVQRTEEYFQAARR